MHLPRNLKPSTLFDQIAVCADAFAFLEDAAKAKEQWDLVIVDPPSFAPNQASVEKAKASYKNLFTNAAKVVQSLL